MPHSPSAAESLESAQKCLGWSQIAMASLRASVKWVSQVKEGPDYVCGVCHRMMYKVPVALYTA